MKHHGIVDYIPKGKENKKHSLTCSLAEEGVSLYLV